MTERDAWLFDLNIRDKMTGELEKRYLDLGSKWEPPLKRDSHTFIEDLVGVRRAIGFSNIRGMYSEDTIDSELIELEQEIMDREHGKLSYKDERLVRSVLFIARQRFKEDADPLPRTENLEDKNEETKDG
jgi:hypothetical protein